MRARTLSGDRRLVTDDWRLAEIDMLVLGYSALYLIEAKSGPGTYTGNVDWWREHEGGATTTWIRRCGRPTARSRSSPRASNRQDRKKKLRF